MTNAPLLRQTLEQLHGELLSEREDRPHWTGCLSASALSTATAVSALCVACRQMQPGESRTRFLELIRRGGQWLDRQQNEDGGFGDTDRSHSNIATSYLVLAAWTLRSSTLPSDPSEPRSGNQSNLLERLRSYLDDAGGIPALRQRYGTDKTFVVPIMTNLAIAGLVPWSEVAALPFEAAVFPQSMYRFLGMPVVSYAVPALVAIGQAKFSRSGCLPPWSWVRRSAIAPSLKVLQRMQPDSGGYLEATPLTAFVVMSLLEVSDEGEHAKDGLAETTVQPNQRTTSIDARRKQVIQRGLEFLERSMDIEGSWPIDTNLATWVTSLSVSAISRAPQEPDRWSSDSLVDWILSCQHRARHPFTGADPGGWGWTDLSGAVPDADDTPGAIVALSRLRERSGEEQRTRIDQACQLGKNWLIDLQNRDGGWPTFCRGWGKLPFDRSSTDLTAHAIRALSELPACRQSESATRRGLAFLRQSQRSDGSWTPLWFGNQDRPEEDNPIYGTAKVLVDVPVTLGSESILRGIEYLVTHQNEDGGWGGGDSVARYFASRSARPEGAGRPDEATALEKTDCSEEERAGMAAGRGGAATSSVEETALAVEALASLWDRLQAGEFPGKLGENWKKSDASPSLTDRTGAAILAGTQWLICAVDAEHHRVAWPIGFYFAKLWYHERLYPLIFTTAALGRAAGLDDLFFPDHDDTP